MKTPIHLIVILAASVFLINFAGAQVPHMISYQGRAKTAGGAPFTGTGHFKFALVDAAGTYTYWSNDGMMGAGAAPVGIVQLAVTNGVYSVHLGNTTIAGMTANVPPPIFTNSHVFLRVWFSDGSVAPALTTPDTRIVSVGYAMIAATVVDGSITEAKLADGSVTSSKLAAGAITASMIADASVTSEKLAIGSVTGRELADEIQLGGVGTGAGVMELYSGTGPGVAIKLDGSAGTIRASDAFQIGSTQALLSAESSRGVLRLYDEDQTQVALLRARSGAGDLYLFQNDGNYGLLLSGDLTGVNSGGYVRLANGDGNERLSLQGDSSGAGLITVRNASGLVSVSVDGASGGGAGGIQLYQSDGETVGVDLRADADGGGGRVYLNQNDGDVGVYIDGNDENGAGLISVRNTQGNASIRLYGGETSSDGGQIILYNANEGMTVQIDGDDGDSGGWVGLYDSDGTKRIELDANASGGARITTQVLEITGGSDLSENFDIASFDEASTPKPGMIVCIDPLRPGQLLVSSKAYDHTVAGIMSGAGGVQPGMLMGQRGTAADGKHPVALTGRVYCLADASHGAIEPGDLLTTSDFPGHAMKVTNPARAQGAIIGKAMTPLTKGRSLVLVLVSLQ